MKLRSLAAPLLGALLVAPVQALDILVTNDDGYQHPWINLLRDRLVEAGHQVTLVGPAVNQSGQGTALTLDVMRKGDNAFTNPQPGIYAVEGTPGTAVIVGVRQVLKERPDLVISGINDGANIGVLSSFSGTVGATVAALNMVGEPIPGIAISTNRLDKEREPGAEPNLSHAGDVADFVVRLVKSLEASRDGEAPLLPRGIALNVNYPAVPRGEVKGVGLYRHGPVDWTLYGAPASTAPAPAPDSAEWDTTGLGQGYITVVPINGDYTAPAWNSSVPQARLPQLAQ